MLKWLGGLVDRVFAVAGAVLFMQAPLFMQQYVLQLHGREAELKLQVDSMRNAAMLTGKTLEQFIQKFISSTDIDFSHQGELMQTMFSRWQHFSDALAAIQTSTVWERPFVFMTHLNTEVFKGTLHNFSVGLPLNAEGGIYALIGIFSGYFIFAMMRKFSRKVSSLFSRAFKTNPQT